MKCIRQKDFPASEIFLGQNVTKLVLNASKEIFFRLNITRPKANVFKEIFFLKNIVKSTATPTATDGSRVQDGSLHLFADS